MEPNAGNETFTGLGDVAAGSLEGLFEPVECRFGGAAEDAFAEPLAEQAGGAGVLVGSIGVAGLFFAEFDLDEIVRREFQIFLAHLGVDFVVRLGEHVSRFDACGVVKHAIKWSDVCHKCAR